MGRTRVETERPFVKGVEIGTLVASASLISVPFVHFVISRIQGMDPESLRQMYVEYLLPASPIALVAGVVVGGIAGIIYERRQNIRKLTSDSLYGPCIGGK